MELKDLGVANLTKTDNSFNYSYKKTNKFPMNKKDFFEAALSRNKTELDEPLINTKSNKEDETDEKKNHIMDKVFS